MGCTLYGALQGGPWGTTPPMGPPHHPQGWWGGAQVVHHGVHPGVHLEVPLTPKTSEVMISAHHLRLVGQM